jgi:O-antigen/teichoic acid export membrane protein
VQIAFYSLSFNLARYILLLPNVVSNAAAATIGVEHGRDPSRTGQLAIGTMRVLALVCIPAAFGLAALADPILHVMYGDKYLPAIPAFTLLAVLTVGRALQLPARQLMLATDRQHVILKWTVVLAVVNLGLDLALIPSYGAVGAAAAKGLMNVIGAVTIWWIVAIGFNAAVPVARLVRMSGAGLVMFLAVRWLAGYLPSPVAVVIGPVVGVAIVVALYRVLRCLDPEDRLVLSALERRLPARVRPAYALMVGLLFATSATPSPIIGGPGA